MLKLCWAARLAAVQETGCPAVGADSQRVLRSWTIANRQTARQYTTRAMKWLQLVPPAGAIVLLALAALIAPTPALAVDNVVRIDPSGIEVAPGGSFHVKLIDDPTPASTAIWAIDVVYDPAVVSHHERRLRRLSNAARRHRGLRLPGRRRRQGWDANETVKVLGVVLFTGTQTGLVDVSTLADITFHVVGAAGACTDLHLRIRSHADKDGNETGALVQDGRACIEADAPPSGTASPNPVHAAHLGAYRGAYAGGGYRRLRRPQAASRTDRPGQTAPTGGQGASRRLYRALQAAQQRYAPAAAVSDSDDDGGTSPLVWVLAGGIVLVLAAGAAWSLVRLRGAKAALGQPA